MHRTLIFVCALFTTVSLARLSTAAVIDFESKPGGGPTLPADDDQPIVGAYSITGGGTVQFFFDRDGDNELTAGDDPGIFERINQDGNDGFVNTGLGTNDVAAPGFAAQLGQWFLRGVTPGAVPPPFIVDYNTAQTITALSGEIWDIDGNASAGTEQWLVEVLDSSNSVLATLNSPLGTDLTMDSMPWTFAFTGLPTDVDKVRVTFTGTKTFGVGLAFNNFSPTIALPEPSAIALVAIGALPLAMLVLRRQRRA
jgi:hypothetical protein